MTLEQHKQKILGEFAEGFERFFESDIVLYQETVEFMSRAIDSTAEETYKAVKLERRTIVSDDYEDFQDRGVNEAIRLMEDKYKEFKG